MSGGDSLKARQEVKDKLQEKFPDMSRSYTITSDTVAPIETAFPQGTILAYS